MTKKIHRVYGDRRACLFKCCHSIAEISLWKFDVNHPPFNIPDSFNLPEEWDYDCPQEPLEIEDIEEGSIIEDMEVTVSEHELKADAGQEHILVIDESSKPPLCIVVAGLRNLGKTGYINSVLQCLTHTASLTARLDSYRYQKPCLCGNKQFCVVRAIHVHVQAAMKTSLLSPDGFVKNLKYFSPVFELEEEQDAHEFFMEFLSKLEMCCFDRTRDISSQDNIVENVFGGSLISTVRCCNCNCVSETSESSRCLSLDIQNAACISSALDSFFRVERLEGQLCHNCKQTVSKEKKYLLGKQPLVAALHLKRFMSHRGFSEKISKPISVPFVLDLQPYMQYDEVPTQYHLYAFAKHNGSSLNRGHYISYAKTAPKVWHKFDDVKVDSFDEDCVKAEQSYILFYAREEVQRFIEVLPKSVLHPKNSDRQKLEMESNKEGNLSKALVIPEEKSGSVPLVQRDPMASQEVHLQLLQERGMATNSGSSFEAEKSDGECVTTIKAQKVRGPRRVDSYLFCYQNFYTLPEMIKYMKENHGVGETKVKNVFRELLQGRKAEAYLRESQERMKTRTTTTT